MREAVLIGSVFTNGLDDLLAEAFAASERVEVVEAGADGGVADLLLLCVAESLFVADSLAAEVCELVGEGELVGEDVEDFAVSPVPLSAGV